MICENCKQRPATVTVTQSRDNKKVVRHYCSTCSQQLNNMEAEDPISMQQLFADWFGIPTWSANAPKSQQEVEQPDACPDCGMTYQQFLHDGKFNCPMCYDAFREQLPQVMKRLHNGAVQHVGKVPGTVNETYQIKQQIDHLRTEMRKAVEEEYFEEAAVLRDQIKTLEQQLQGGDTDGA